MDFASASPSVVRSVKQLGLLNAWLLAFAKCRALPHVTDFQPDRIEEERADMVTFDVIGEGDRARFLITHEGAQLRSAYGNRPDGPKVQNRRFLDDAVGTARYARLVTLYRACLAAARPVYSISMLRDVDGKEVSYERLLLPFGNATTIDHIVGSYKAISIDGSFKIQDLMRLNPDEAVIVVRAVIDRDLVRGKPGKRIADDLEFS
jgi:hypothetical protein